jgi:hypothetical protein
MNNREQRDHPLADWVRAHSTFHRQGAKPNIFLFSTPRSGSTWAKELLNTQPGMKYCNEPFNLRSRAIRSYLGTDQWDDLYQDPISPKVVQYLDAIEAGKPETGFQNAFPFKENYRLITQRIVYKVLHALEDRIDWVKDTYGAKVILLLRHPIAVALSREYCPRLETFVGSPYQRHFSAAQLQYAREVIEQGSQMDKLMLSWCLQNAVPLRQAQPDWTVMTYEQLTLNPEPIVDLLCDLLDLDDPDRVKANLSKPSGSTHKSDAETQQALKAGSTQTDKRFLIEKWRKKVDEAEEARLMAMLSVFDIDAYQAGSFLPHQRYWLGSTVPTPQP